MNARTDRGPRGMVCLLLLGLLLASCAPKVPAKPQAAQEPLSPAGSQLPAAAEAGAAGPAAPTPGASAAGAGQVVAGVSAAPGSFDGDLRELPAVPNAEREEKEGEEAPQAQRPAAPTNAAAPAQQDAPVAPNLPALGQNFAGLGKGDSCGGVPCGAGYPPDTVGDVGPNHYIQAVNTAFGVFSKTGSKLASVTFNSLWAADTRGTPCTGKNQGDPTVVYDPLADRWILADFAFTNSGGSISGPYYECIAVSKTGDPVSGGWWLYPINVSATQLPDYPKMAIWTDGLYVSYNMFTSTFQGIHIQALNRDDLESGAAVRIQSLDTGVVNGQFTEFTLLPVNLRGATPPAGTPAYFVGESLTNWAWDVFKLSVNWSAGTHSFTGPTHVQQMQYDLPEANNSTDIIPQSSSATLLDSLGDRLMMQAQYRKIGSQESIWVAHTVRPLNSGTSPTAIHWAELNVTGGVVAGSSKQEQVFANGSDGLYRWTPSIAVDAAGNALVGYSASNGTHDPTIRLAGRLATDPSGTLGQGETTVSTPSTGAQSLTCGGAPCSRWGDYSGMSVDPVDDCTFWYTNEYYATTGSLSWQTRIASLKFPSCGSAPAAPSLALAKTAQPGTYAQAGAQIVYTYALQNTGNVTLAGPALVTDDKMGAAFSCGSGSLAPGEGTSCTRTYTVTQADVDNGSVRNTATASMTYNGQAVRSGPTTVTVDAVQTPRLGLTKTANRTRFSQAGDQIVYSYSVANTGNVTLTGPFSVSDDHRGTALTCAAGSLAPGAGTSCQWTYTVTAADATKGSVVNRATASGSFGGQAVVSPVAIWVVLSNAVAKATFLPVLSR